MNDDEQRLVEAIRQDARTKIAIAADDDMIHIEMASEDRSDVPLIIGGLMASEVAAHEDVPAETVIDTCVTAMLNHIDRDEILAVVEERDDG